LGEWARLKRKSGLARLILEYLEGLHNELKARILQLKVQLTEEPSQKEKNLSEAL
jgi:hypothetical protein